MGYLLCRRARFLGMGLVLSASAALAGPGQTSFELSFNGSQFDLTLRQTYDARSSLDEVQRTLSDPGLVPQVSNIVSRVVRSLADGEGRFNVQTKATQKIFGIELSATTGQRCREERTPTRWSQSCEMDLSQGQTAKFFYAGSNSISCEMTSQVVCVLKASGRPKPLNALVFKRSPEQLAIAGAYETTHDLSLLFWVQDRRMTPQAAKAAWEKSKLGILVTKMADDSRKQLNDDGKLSGGRTLRVSGNDETGAFSLQ